MHEITELADQSALKLVTIARQLGSGGSYIGQLVARRLGYAYIDRQIMQQAAKELGVEEAEIEGREGRLQSFWEKLISLFAMAEEMIASVAGHLPADEVWPWMNEPL